MGFDEFFGNKPALDAVRAMLAKERLPHSMMFCGAAGLGKYTLAQMLAKAIHCTDAAAEQAGDFCGHCTSCKSIALADDRWKAVEEAEEDRDRLTKRPREVPLIIQHHPDVMVLAPNGPLRLFQIEQARHLKQALGFVPAGNKKKIFILPDAERMDSAAANSLLKSLEEPPQHTLLLLTTSNEAALLPTIRSRCVPLWLGPLPAAEVAVFLERHGVGGDAKERLLRATISKGSPGAALRLDLDRYVRSRTALIELLQAGAERHDFATFFAQSQKLSGKEENLESLLDVLYSLLHDILHIETKASSEPLRNSDRPKALMQLSRYLGARGVMQVMATLENLERNLRRNVPIRLSLEAVALSLPPARRTT